MSWSPRVTVKDTSEMTAGQEKTTSVFQFGMFAGFNVPFFDLN